MSKQDEIVVKPISEAIGGEMAEEKEVPKRLSRKDFVKGAAVVAGAGALASCAPAATPAPEAAPTCPPAEECPPCPTPAAAGEAGPVTLEVYNPLGIVETTEVPAPRVADLNGKTICTIWNGLWRGGVTFPILEELLQERFPDAKIIPHTEFPNYYYTGDSSAVSALKEAGCDAVIVGNGF